MCTKPESDNQAMIREQNEPRPRKDKKKQKNEIDDMPSETTFDNQTQQQSSFPEDSAFTSRRIKNVPSNTVITDPDNVKIGNHF